MMTVPKNLYNFRLKDDADKIVSTLHQFLPEYLCNPTNNKYLVVC